ncbi:MAG: 16S rRNA (cytidine(1402)-2'-O)-methyltransferase, partial [Acutalibacteraceae bacterium]
ESVPGPTAFATALAISGMPSGRFTFEGFLSQNKVSRREHLESLENEERTMIFYEAPHKLQNTLNDFKKYFGEDRRIAVVREITKIHEETAVCTVGEAILRFEENPPRGEFVLIVGGKRRQERSEMTLEQAVALARDYVKSGKSSSDGAKAAAKISGFKKSDIYSGLLK